MLAGSVREVFETMGMEAGRLTERVERGSLLVAGAEAEADDPVDRMHEPALAGAHARGAGKFAWVTLAGTSWIHGVGMRRRSRMALGPISGPARLQVTAG